MPDDPLREELLEMHRADQAIREEALEVVRRHGAASPEFAALRARGREIDARHVARLVEILDTHGWPGTSRVGADACNGAFLVLQHADPETQKRFLPLARRAADAGELPRASLALLEDRVLVRDGQPQVYGTQVQRDADGRPCPFPIADEDGVEARRAAVGLEPLAEYLRRFEQRT